MARTRQGFVDTIAQQQRLVGAATPTKAAPAAVEAAVLYGWQQWQQQQEQQQQFPLVASSGSLVDLL
jgi:hypothetical protein